MNLAEIIEEAAGLGVKDPILDVFWKQFVNRAQRRICQRKNWTFMGQNRPITVLSGSTSAPMGRDFKQLGEEESPVSFTYGLYKLPVKVTTRERVEAAGIWPLQNGPFSLPIPGGYMPVQVVFLECTGGEWTLSVPPQYSVTTDAVFNVQGFWFPADLKLGDDSNALTNHGELCEALINLTKALAYHAKETNDPRGDAAMKLYEEAFEVALYSDSAQSRNGVTWRM